MLFPTETEHVSLSHLQLAQSMREEAKKLEEFREKQKEARKKVGGFISTEVTEASWQHVINWWLDSTLSFQLEQQMDALHKQRSSQFKKTMDVSIMEGSDT